MTDLSAPAARSTAALKAVLVTSCLLLVLGTPFVLLALVDLSAVARLPPAGILLALLSVLYAPLPLTFGLIVAASGADPRTPDGRRSLRRVLVIAGSSVTAVTCAVIVTAVTGVLSFRSAVALSIVIATLTGASVWLGTIIRRREAVWPRPPWPPLDARIANLPRRVRWMYWSLVIALGIVVAALATAVAITRDTSLLDPSALLSAVSIPLIVAAMTGGIINLTANSDAGTVLGPDRGRQERITRALHTRSAETLPAEDRALARRYAGVTASLIPLQVGQLILLCAAFAAMRASSLLTPDEDFRPLDIAFLAVVTIAAAVLVPLLIRRGRWHRDFAATTDEPSPAPSTGVPE